MKRFALLLLLAAPSLLFAENWAQFRGPNFNGFTSETNLPAEWSETKNMVWTADMPGASAAVPIVWEDKVFVSTTDAEDESLWAMCLSRANGKVLWKHRVADGVRRDTRSNFAAPTPATDGEVVVFFYGNGPMATYDLDGNELWKRDITQDYGDFAFLWTFSTSPLLHDGRLYLQVLQRDTPVDGRGFAHNESYLLALDPKTGKEVWRVVRPSNAWKESREAFTTPIPFHHNGRDELLVVGGDALSGHDPVTGKELWRWGTWNPEKIGHWRLVPSPVAGKGVILACAPKKEPIYAIKAGGNGDLSDNEDAVVWTSVDPKIVSSDVPTPAFAYGDFFVLNKDRRVMARVNPTDGEIKWHTRVPGSDDYESSPLVCDGKIYIVSHTGRVVVIDAENGEQLFQMQMDKARPDKTRASIVAAQGQLFIRTTNKLYCIAKQ